MSVVSDYPDASPHVATAAQIAATGVPLLGNAQNLVATGIITISPGDSISYNPLTFTQVGYNIGVEVYYPSAATVPFLGVELQWQATPGANIIDYEYYYAAGAENFSYFATFGAGYAKGPYCGLTLVNLDPAQTATVICNLYQDSIVRPFDKWHWYNPPDASLTVPGYTLADIPADNSVLGVLNAVTVAASSTGTYLIGMAPGQQVTFAGNAAGITLSDIVMTGFAEPDSEYFSNGITFRQVPSTTEFTYTFTAPGGPMTVRLTNGATSGTLTVSGMFTAQSP